LCLPQGKPDYFVAPPQVEISHKGEGKQVQLNGLADMMMDF
jgi:hypothetical protein